MDIIDHVIFKRDLEGRLRGKCKLCRPGRCCVYRMQKMESCPQDKQDPTRSNHFGCVCGHSTFHHEVVEESKLYGKKPVGSTSTKASIRLHVVHVVNFIAAFISSQSLLRRKFKQ
ncbi:hypothetical protein AM587_10005813 [Phytophthora nicotianae]|uniref:Uncharacterized protein n=1 Tax=Phytophthora nicotianae TaxID=4792 RepID=A0A0W8CUA2_PHYNI|nr:hypothetical protein AM587_10005813 [Phytophthora nicotianae]